MRVERLRYESIEAYMRAVSLLMINAYSVEQLKTALRVCPQASCETVAPRRLWRAVWLTVRPGRPLPASPPSVAEFVTEVARLGGYQSKPSSGLPDSLTLYRGLREAEAYRRAIQAVCHTLDDV